MFHISKECFPNALLDYMNQLTENKIEYMNQKLQCGPHGTLFDIHE